MTGGESNNEDVGGLPAGCIIVDFVVGDLETVVVQDAEIVDHEGLVLHELIQGSRRGDLLDFTLVLLLPECAPEGVEDAFAGGVFFPCWGPCYQGSRWTPSRAAYWSRRVFVLRVFSDCHLRSGATQRLLFCL